MAEAKKTTTRKKTTRKKAVKREKTRLEKLKELELVLQERLQFAEEKSVAALARQYRETLKEIEEIEELTTANREIVTELSHDLRTPLTAVLLYAEILKADRFDSEEKRNECIEKIVGKMERLDGINTWQEVEM